MSKSKGNVIDPLMVMDKYGTDAFRFTLAALSVQGRDIRLSEERIGGYRNFVNKIWNASRFVLMNLEDYEFTQDDMASGSSSLVEKWIISRLHRLIKEVEVAFREYKFNEVAHLIYHFIWHEFCDWYLELIKPALYQKEDLAVRRATQGTMKDVLSISLQLLHPLMPFITEEIWQQLPSTQGSIMISPYPRWDAKCIDERAEEEMGLIMEVVNSIRNVRWEMNVPPAHLVEVVLCSENTEQYTILTRQIPYVEKMAKARKVTVVKGGEKPRATAIAVARGVEIFLPLKGITDFDEEERRLQREIGKTVEELSVINKKLSNQDFLTRAPLDVVEKEKCRAQELKEKKEKLESGLRRVRECRKES